MVRPIAAFAALSAGVFAGDVDFTPRESFYLAEATKVPNIAFRNGSQELTYSPPGKWTLSGGGRKVTLTPQEKVQASATMQSTPVGEPLPVTEANLPAYSDLAMRLLPREATKVTVVETTVASLRICTHAMAEVTLTYALFGQAYTTNILFLPYEKQQLTFQVTARSADFAPLAKAFRASLFSMQGL